MKVPVYKINGKKSTKDIDLPKAVFDIEPNDNAIYQAILAERANRRQGTHKVKVRSEVRGGGKKPWRQKGTGRARIGTSRAPHWRGGGVVFGPHNRDHSMKLNKKVKRLARISAFSQKYREKKITSYRKFFT